MGERESRRDKRAKVVLDASAAGAEFGLFERLVGEALTWML